MLTPTEITAGAARLEDGKLTAVDVDGLVSVFRMFFGDLEEKYGYEFQTKLEALDDTDNTAQQCAQIGACLDKLESLGFGVSSLQGGADALYYREKDKYAQYVIIAFSKIYPVPVEFTAYDWRRRKRTAVTSTQARSYRSECWE